MVRQNKEKLTSSINDPQRCEICSATLTLYPKGFQDCPHCNKRVCRQCWGANWNTRTFSKESCSHVEQAVVGSVSPLMEKASYLRLDWTKVIFWGILIIILMWFIYFLANLLIF